MPKAVWNDQVIAEANDAEVQVVEGNVYFPHEAVKPEFVKASTHTSVCPWKGTANYFDVVVDGKRNADAAWTYRTPKDAAKEITGHIAFWRGVQVQQ